MRTYPWAVAAGYSEVSYWGLAAHSPGMHCWTRVCQCWPWLVEYSSDTLKQQNQILTHISSVTNYRIIYLCFYRLCKELSSVWHVAIMQIYCQFDKEKMIHSSQSPPLYYDHCVPLRWVLWCLGKSFYGHIHNSFNCRTIFESIRSQLTINQSCLIFADGFAPHRYLLKQWLSSVRPVIVRKKG